MGDLLCSFFPFSFGFLEPPGQTKRLFLYKELAVYPICPSIVHAGIICTETGSSFPAPLSLPIRRLVTTLSRRP